MDEAGLQERHRGVAKVGVACRMIWFLKRGVRAE